MELKEFTRLGVYAVPASLAAASGRQLLQDAADRLGRPCVRTERTGRVEREVLAAADG